ncbi:set domain protein [Diplodia corticola]|uniref:Set domain protein n=1 Tax=Diplodia corticola TaxID=236234 RepID=A0A1J9RL01_9PEZI|nr:set domain protein [Diplodia corticola]OJD33259.1 set domain protein [Diplodia corticola]
MLVARGRTEGWLRLPVSALRVWAAAHDVTFQGITVGPLPGFEQRGSTVIADGSLSAGNAEPLMIIPRDLVLSLDAVRMHAKSDLHLRELVDALADFGRVTVFAQASRRPAGDIMPSPPDVPYRFSTQSYRHPYKS